MWQNGRAKRLHGVILATDSMQSRSCDSCRVALPLTAVDSVRLGHPERGFWKTVGLTLGGAAVLGLVSCALDLAGECQSGD